jgi:hypothetical protein
MPVTIAVQRRRRVGSTREVTVDITGPASYLTNGEVITAAQVANLFPEVSPNAVAIPTNLNGVLEFRAEDSTAGHAIALDRANLKFKYFNGTTEIAATTNLSAVVARCTFVYQPSSG